MKEEDRPYIAKVKVSLVKEGTVNERIVIESHHDAANLSFIRDELLASDREMLICLHLNIKHIVISYEIVSVGSLNFSVVHPRECFKGAMLANAAAVIVYHNHPSGDPEPSAEDVTVTKRLVDAGKILGIEVLDHIVFGDKGFVSLKDRGLM
jgi:DNA repair protein RadC